MYYFKLINIDLPNVHDKVVTSNSGNKFTAGINAIVLYIINVRRNIVLLKDSPNNFFF